MFNTRSAINTYVAVDDTQNGASFEKRWFESVLTLINRVMNNEFNPVEAHKKLLEVCEGLQWVQENLNEKLNSQHRTLLKNIYGTNIQILNSAMKTGDFEYLPLVAQSIQIILEPYDRSTPKS
jgi:hypothetical protein